LFVCVPNIFDKEFNKKTYKQRAFLFWEKQRKRKGYLWSRLFKKNVYGDALITRFYVDLKDKSDCPAYVEKLKQIWDGRDIVFIEGEGSRLGVSNDLFDNAKTIKRILGPNKNAFDKFDEIIQFTRQNVAKESLVLLALGPTATCLAVELNNCGFQAIDVGHVDVEYEWMRMSAAEKVTIQNKNVNELNLIGDSRVDDDAYHSQVIASFV